MSRGTQDVARSYDFFFEVSSRVKGRRGDNQSAVLLVRHVHSTTAIRALMQRTQTSGQVEKDGFSIACRI